MDEYRKIEIPQPGIYTDKPIPGVYAVIDNDLARDNLENDLTEADKQYV